MFCNEGFVTFSDLWVKVPENYLSRAREHWRKSLEPQNWSDAASRDSVAFYGSAYDAVEATFFVSLGGQTFLTSPKGDVIKLDTTPFFMEQAPSWMINLQILVGQEIKLPSYFEAAYDLALTDPNEFIAEYNSLVDAGMLSAQQGDGTLMDYVARVGDGY